MILLLLLLLLTALAVLTTNASTLTTINTGTCSAAVKSQLDPVPLSTEELEILNRLLPQPTSEQSVASGELRAPLHIPCQLRGFPFLQEFVAEIQHHEIPNFEVKGFAQPPHLVFFDGEHDVVRTVVVSPTWTGFELRDLVVANLEG